MRPFLQQRRAVPRIVGMSVGHRIYMELCRLWFHDIDEVCGDKPSKEPQYYARACTRLQRIHELRGRGGARGTESA